MAPNLGIEAQKSENLSKRILVSFTDVDAVDQLRSNELVTPAGSATKPLKAQGGVPK